MYSKFNDRRPSGMPRPSPRTTPRSAPVGTPSYRQRVHVPPNYSGLAIVDGEERLPGTHLSDDPPVTESPSDALPDNRDFGQVSPPEPRFDDLEQVSDLSRRDSRLLPVLHSAAEDALPPPRAPGFLDLAHFPFGHGIGAEEWLLIGLILLVLHEAGGDRRDRHDRSDHGDLDETVILLALLLLGG